MTGVQTCALPIWLENQPDRYRKLDLENVPNPFDGNGWISQGLYWGLFMYICMILMYPLIDGESVTLKKTLLSIPIWTIGGLGFGYTMKLISGRKTVKN